MRKIIEFFIRYAVPTNIIIFGVLVFGYLGMTKIKSSFFPLVPTTKVSVSIVYPGASPTQIEEGVVTKMEESLKGIEGIDRVTSRSYENAANITVELLKGIDANIALQEIKNAIDGVTSLPGDMENPIIAKVEETAPTMDFTVSGKGIDLKTLKGVARKIELDLLDKDGISKIELAGFPDEEIEIAVHEQYLRAYDLTFQDISNAVAATNIITTGGNIKTKEEDYIIRVNNKNYYADEIDNIVVKTTPQGNVIRLKDIAKVTDKFNESPDRLAVNGNIAVRLTVSNTNSEDLLSTSKTLKAYIKDFNERNSNLNIEILSDRAEILNQRTKLLLDNGFFGVLLVILLLSIFLDVRLAIWVGLGLVISLLGFFIFGSFFNVTINVLSLFGLIMVIGVLVDDGIVISENIYHHYEMGKGRVQAAVDGTMEVMPAIISAILTTVVAFTTFFFIEGRLGYFFSEVSRVVIITLLISLFEALIILPSHLAHSKALSKDKKPWLINKWGDKLMNFLRDNLYTPSIKFILKAPYVGIAIFAALAMMTIGGFKGEMMQFEFFPSISSDKVDVRLTLPQGTNENITDSIINFIEEKVWETSDEFKQKYPGIDPMRFIERRLGAGSNVASLGIFLLEGEERPFPASEFADALRKNTGRIYGVESLIFNDGGAFGGKPISVAFLSSNVDDLHRAKDKFKSILENDDRMADISDDDPKGIKEIIVKLKPNAEILGFTLGNVMSQVRSAFFGREVQRLQRGRDEVKVWVRYDIKDRSSIKNLDNMWLRTPSGDRVPFSEIAEYSIERGVVSINHLGGKRVINVSAGLSSAELNGAAILEELQENAIADLLTEFPSLGVSYEGQSREAAKTMGSLKTAGGLSLIIILFIIAFTFRTYTKPFLFLPIIILSLIGVTWGHFFSGIKVNILSMLGIVALIGILVNDGLVLIAKLNSNIKAKMPYMEALLEACKSRFRPIFLTSITTVAGLAPLMFEKSRQAQFLIPMAVSIVYGIAFATILTLYLLPILLMAHNYVKRFFMWVFTGQSLPGEQVERAYIELIEEKRDLKEH